MDDKTFKYVQRLINCGVVADCARQMCGRYIDAGDENGLREYITFVEKLLNDEHEYPKEV